MSYPFSSLSTVSFTKDMLPGSLTLKREHKQDEDVTLTRASISPGNNLDSAEARRSPFRAAHDRTDDQRGQDADAKATGAVQGEHHPFGCVRGRLRQRRAPRRDNQQTAAGGRTDGRTDALPLRVNPLIAAKVERTGGYGRKKVSGALRMESDVKCWMSSPPRRQHWLRFPPSSLTEQEALTFGS